MNNPNPFEQTSVESGSGGTKCPLSITEEDLARAVSVLSEVAILNGTIEDKKDTLMKGVIDLVQADCWVWTLIAPASFGEKMVPVNFLHGGFSSDRLAAYLEAIEHPDMPRLNAPFLADLFKSQSHTTRSRHQLDPANHFPSLPVYQLWQRASIDQLILSGHPFTDGSVSLVALYRNAGALPFSDKECRLVHIVLSEIKWLHAQAWPQRKQENYFDYLSLSPRKRTILSLLLEGQGRKQIAHQLDLSENTIAGYTRELYRFYRVQSHAELVSRFRFGDGGDTPCAVPES